MIDHFEIRVIKFEECVRFYSMVLQSLEIELKWSDELAAGFGEIGSGKVEFLIEKSNHNSECHVAFAAPDEEAVNQFHKIGVDNGFESNGAPGVRERYAPNYYAAFLYDPDNNNVEAVVYV